MRMLVIIAAALGLTMNADAAEKKGKGKASAAATAPAATTDSAAPTVDRTPAAAEPSHAPEPAPATTVASAPLAAPAATATPASASETVAAKRTVHEVKATPEATVKSGPPPAEQKAIAKKADDLGLNVAAKIGGTVPTSKLGATYNAALEVGYRLPLFKDILGDLQLGAAAELGYFEPQFSGSNTSDAAGSYNYRLDQRAFTLLLEGTLTYPMGDLKPYGGVGWGAYMLRAKMTAFGKTNTESQTRAGLQLRGGVGYHLGYGDLFAEARYHYVGLHFRTTGVTNDGGVTVAAGYRFGF